MEGKSQGLRLVQLCVKFIQRHNRADIDLANVLCHCRKPRLYLQGSTRMEMVLSALTNFWKT